MQILILTLVVILELLLSFILVDAGYVTMREMYAIGMLLGWVINLPLAIKLLYK